jgi:hypothetical protein
MITMSDLGNNGRLGNQLFQYASLIGLAHKHNTELKLPEWSYAKHFDFDFPEGEIDGRYVKEAVFNYIPEWPYIKENENVDIHGYLQSEKYWIDCKDEVLKAITFKPEFLDQVRKQFEDKNIFKKETIAISIRRGDYVNNPCYELLPITYYILALFDHFPDWRDCNIVVFSDDIPYCKVHFDCIPNVFFSENNSDIEDICLMSQCDNFIISNSTFSWWGAYLGESKGGKVIRPNYLFAGKLLQRNNWVDFYPERWTVFDHKKESGENKKIDLSDTCFTIPVSYDHEDRKENIDLCIAILRKNFDTNILVSEQVCPGREALNHFGFEYFEGRVDDYTLFVSEKFWRTSMLNHMSKRTNCEFIFNWDADVFIAPLQIYEAVQQLRSGTDMVYPYAWAFARMPRNIWFVKIRDHEDIGMVGDTKFNGMNNADAISVGGAVGYNRKRFIEGGMENENFISYGAEDVERKIRFEKLGYRIERTLGQNLYHINHFVGPNSCQKHEDFASNEAELEKVKCMDQLELKEYLNSWSWLK